LKSKTLHPSLRNPAEGNGVSGQDEVKVGDQITVQFANLSIERGFIDFVCPGK